MWATLASLKYLSFGFANWYKDWDKVDIWHNDSSCAFAPSLYPPQGLLLEAIFNITGFNPSLINLNAKPEQSIFSHSYIVS